MQEPWKMTKNTVATEVADKVEFQDIVGEWKNKRNECTKKVGKKQRIFFGYISSNSRKTAVSQESNVSSFIHYSVKLNSSHLVRRHQWDRFHLLVWPFFSQGENIA